MRIDYQSELIQPYIRLNPVSRDDLLPYLSSIGVIMPYHGKLLFDVRPEPGAYEEYSSQSLKGLYPHLEKYELAEPPDLLVLYCLQPDRHGGGQHQRRTCHEHRLLSDDRRVDWNRN